MTQFFSEEMWLLPSNDNHNETWNVYSTYMENRSICRHHFYLDAGKIPKASLPISLLPKPHITRRSLSKTAPSPYACFQNRHDFQSFKTLKPRLSSLYFH